MIEDFLSTPSHDARLAALGAYGVLDTLPESGFDDVVHLAAALCDTPVALVSLVDKDRQWFKARLGFEACETPLSQSVCRHALARPDVLVIPDLTSDSRTWDNTLVTEAPHIRFYAGAPLITPEGVIVGTLCVIDTTVRPQGLTPRQAELLQALARQVIMQLELRKAVTHSETAARQHQADRERSIQAEEAGGIGTFELDIASNMMEVSAEFCRIFGLVPNNTYPAGMIEERVLIDDRDLRSDLERRQDGTAGLQVEYRIRRADSGEIRWVSRRASFAMGDDGLPVTMFGTVHDVTERHRAHLQQTRLLQLGDALREASSSHQVLTLAAQALGEVLGVDRAGYARVDGLEGTFSIETEWHRDGITSLKGTHPLAGLPVTVERLAAGETLSIANIPATSWLGRDLPQYAKADTRAMIDIPLIDHGKLVGIAYAHQSSGRTWRRDEIDFAHGVADRTYAALAQLDAEANQRLLNGELGHRMKNQLALVMAIVGQTLRSASDMATASSILTARIQVLANAHDMLIAGTAGRSTVLEIVHQVLRLHDDVLKSRFTVDGPAIPIASRPALSLSLMLHELSTNAAKYGALSVPEGKVSITWTVEGKGRHARFSLVWAEQGGPAVIAPPRRGSGSRLIQAGLSGTVNSTVTLDYLPHGVCCTVAADLDSIESER